MSKPRAKKSTTPAQQLATALAVAIAVAALLIGALLRPAVGSPIQPVWEPRPPVLDLIPGPPGPPPR